MELNTPTSASSIRQNNSPVDHALKGKTPRMGIQEYPRYFSIRRLYVRRTPTKWKFKTKERQTSKTSMSSSITSANGAKFSLQHHQPGSYSIRLHGTIFNQNVFDADTGLLTGKTH